MNAGEAVSSGTSQESTTQMAAAAVPAVRDAPLDIGLDPVAVHAALANGFRYWAVWELAKGRPLSAGELASRGGTGYSTDLALKLMQALVKARIVVTRKNTEGDGRQRVYEVPKGFIAPTVAGVRMLDFGVCVLRLAPK